MSDAETLHRRWREAAGGTAEDKIALAREIIESDAPSIDARLTADSLLTSALVAWCRAERNGSPFHDRKELDRLNATNGAHISAARYHDCVAMGGERAGAYRHNALLEMEEAMANGALRHELPSFASLGVDVSTMEEPA